MTAPAPAAARRPTASSPAPAPGSRAPPLAPVTRPDPASIGGSGWLTALRAAAAGRRLPAGGGPRCQHRPAARSADLPNVCTVGATIDADCAGSWVGAHAPHRQRTSPPFSVPLSPPPAGDDRSDGRLSDRLGARRAPLRCRDCHSRTDMTGSCHGGRLTDDLRLPVAMQAGLGWAGAIPGGGCRPVASGGPTMTGTIRPRQFKEMTLSVLGMTGMAVNVDRGPPSRCRGYLSGRVATRSVVSRPQVAPIRSVARGVACGLTNVGSG